MCVFASLWKTVTFLIFVCVRMCVCVTFIYLEITWDVMRCEAIKISVLGVMLYTSANLLNCNL